MKNKTFKRTHFKANDNNNNNNISLWLLLLLLLLAVVGHQGGQMLRSGAAGRLDSLHLWL